MFAHRGTPVTYQVDRTITVYPHPQSYFGVKDVAQYWGSESGPA
jgi:hypothetical protein